MEDIVRTPHEVEFTRKPPLRHSEGIDQRASSVYDTLESEPAPAHLNVRLCDAISESRISHRQNTRESKTEEHARSKGVP